MSKKKRLIERKIAIESKEKKNVNKNDRRTKKSRS